MSATPSSLTVVTVTHESAHVVAGLLDSVLKHLPEAEVIVVDNASTDTTREVAQSHPLGVRFLETGYNAGFARGCNAGAAVASGSFVWFLNPDARVTSVDGGLFADEFSGRPCGLCETSMVGHGDRPRAEIYRHRSAAGERAAHLLTPIWPRTLGRAPWSVARGVDWASGASLVVRKDEFEGLGGFDDSFFLLYEDRELSWRALRAGLPVRGVASLTVTHVQGTASTAANLDVRRRAWAVLSWLEYCAATEGETLARGEWRRIYAGLRSSTRIGRWMSRLGDSKLSRRLLDAEQVVQLIHMTLGNSERFYMRARSVVDEASEGGPRFE